jgi:CubicO group peptidase (beta-lactamase class C family)
MLSALALVLCQADPVHPDLADLAERWRGAMEACGVPALAMVLVEGDEVVHRVTLGRRDPERDVPVTRDTIFYIASITKTYVAFALARLAEEGKLELDAPVKRYLPRFQLADGELTERLTVRDLLGHRHGLNSYPIVLLDAFTGEITEERFYHFLAEVVPAGRVAYSNLHFTLAGRVIEAVTGQPWREHLAEHLFRPAGMTRTTGYADWMYAEDDVAIPAVVRAGGPEPVPLRKTDRTMHAAGGLGTSIDDAARWVRLQLGRGEIDGVRLLSAAATEATWELLTSSKGDQGFGPADGFAFAWERGTYRGHLELRHGGDYTGQSAQIAFLPELGLGLAVCATGGTGAQVLCQLVSTDVHERLLADDEVSDPLPRILASAEAARRREARQPAVAPSVLDLALPVASYAGTFRHEWFGTLTIETEGGGLRARLGSYPLQLSTPRPGTLAYSSPGPLEGEAELELEDERLQAVTLDLGASVRFVR